MKIMVIDYNPDLRMFWSLLHSQIINVFLSSATKLFPLKEKKSSKSCRKIQKVSAHIYIVQPWANHSRREGKKAEIWSVISRNL